MSLDTIFSSIAAQRTTERVGHTDDGHAPSGTMAALTDVWMAAGPRVFGPGPDHDALDALCRWIDVRKQIPATRPDAGPSLGPGAPAEATTVSGVIATLLANAASVGEGNNDAWGLKCLNSALKAIDHWPDVPNASALRVVAATALDRIVTPRDRAAAGALAREPAPGTGAVRTLPLTVLAWEGPQARAYLMRMRRAGLRPERIMLMVRHPSAIGSGRAAGRRRPLLLGRAERGQDRAHNFHPYRLRSKQPELVAAAARAMAPVFADAATAYDEMFDGFSYDSYSDHVIRVSADSHKDPRWAEALHTHGVTTALFTGGGIVPPAVFDVPGIRLMHVHTGLLPHVRGADVLLWSLLTRGRPGVSAFVMTPGLDEGDVLAATELPPIVVGLPPGPRPDDDTLYRVLFSFIDPLLRAELLVSGVLCPAGDAVLPEALPQNLGVGTTFHFMHPMLRARALRMLFADAPIEDALGVQSGQQPGTTSMAADRAARRGSPASYAGFYEKPSARAPMRFALDAGRADSNLRALSIRHRQTDYSRLADDPQLLALHREMNRHLVLQDEDWPSYDYGEGYFYQSSNALGITGLRDTAGRVKAFGLSELVGDRTVLEIGCNTGFLTLEVARTARRVVAFEPNPHLVAIARAAAGYCGVDNVEWLVSTFEEFDTAERFDDVLSFANHHTYDGNTRQDIGDYVARCHRFTRPGGRLLFESHPPQLEGDTFAQTLSIIEHFYEIDRIDVPEYGTFLDKGRRFIVGRRRDTVADVMP